MPHPTKKAGGPYRIKASDGKFLGRSFVVRGPGVSWFFEDKSEAGDAKLCLNYAYLAGRRSVEAKGRRKRGK